MSDDFKINDSNENEDMVNELVEDYTMLPNKDGADELIEKEAEAEDISEKSVNTNSGKKPNFFASFAAIISDGIIIAVLSYLLLYVVDFILRRTAGVYVTEKSQMLFLLYVIVSLIYVSVLESTLGFTVGKTVFGIKVARN